MRSSSTPRHHVIITGTGRAGTTFLVRLLTGLGVDTGFNARTWQDSYQKHCDAGLERDLASPDAPYVVKGPALCETLPALLAEGDIVVDHALIPMREIESAARSRARVSAEHGLVQGGLVGTDDPSQQRAVLNDLFYQLVHTLVLHDVPVTFMDFPRIIHDRDYTFSKLQFLFPHLDRAQFDAVFAKTADPAKVHHFAVTDPLPPPAPLDPEVDRQHRREVARRRRRRHLKRAAAIALAGAALFSVHRWVLPAL